MANTYTPKLNLAKPAHGDVDWHIPINSNWDKIDTELDKALKISGTTIDADKNWNGKSINNVNMITVNKIKATSYLWIADPGLTKPRYINNTPIAKYTTSWVTIKTTPAAKIGVSGTATIYYDFKVGSGGDSGGYIKLLKNDVDVPGSELKLSNSGSSFLAIDVPITTGDIFKLQLKGFTDGRYVSNTNFGIYALMIPIIDENETWS